MTKSRWRRILKPQNNSANSAPKASASRVNTSNFDAPFLAASESGQRGRTLTDAIVNAKTFTAKSANINGPRVLVLDIETAPLEVYAWSFGKQHVGLDQMITDWSLLSVAMKWLGIEGVFYADNRYRANPRDDFEQLLCLHTILQETDMVIAHNGAKFDLPKIRARMALNGFPPLPPITVIDTFQLQAKAFGFTSQKLAYVSGVIGEQEKSAHAKFPGLELWKQVLANNPEAWDEMQHYNVQDVIATEAMYVSLRGWYRNAPNMGPYVAPSKKDGHVCPSCGSENVIRRGTRQTQVGIYPRYHCHDCGSWSRGRLMEVTREQRHHILTN